MTNAEIIAAAFKTWGDDMYMHTSLSSLAAALGITKPALYRYFRDKDQIMEAMLACYIEAHEKATRDLLPRLSVTDFREGFSDYAGALFALYGRNRGYFYFAAKFLLEHEHPFHVRLLSVIQREAAVFAENLAARQGLDDKRIDLVLTTAYTHMLFWCELVTGKNKVQFTGGSTEGLKAMTASLFDGFFPGIDPGSFSPAAVESRLDIDETDLPKTDERLEAIMQVIAREGFHNASISKIAGELNISKSSLYSLFKDKQEMLSKVLCGYRDLLFRSGKEKLDRLDNPFDRFYGYFFLILLYLVKDEKKAKFLNWLRFQNIHPRERKAGFHFAPHPAVEAVFSGSLVTSHGLDPTYLEGCFKVQLVRGVMQTINTNKNLTEHIKDFREVFACLAFGLTRMTGYGAGT